MKSTSELFDLIQSMNKNEKGYFKKYYGIQPRAKNYVILFDAFLKMKTYDEAILLDKIKDYSFSQKGSLHVHKNQLYQLILRSLQMYWEKKKPEIQLHNLINKAQILEDKGLLKQSHKLLHKARQQALESHKTWLLIEIEKRIATQQIEQNSSNVIESVKEIHTRLEDRQKIQNIETELFQCKNELFISTRLAIHDSSVLDKALNRAKSLLQQPHTFDASFRGKHLSLLLEWGIYFKERHYKAAHQTLETLVKHWESFPKIINEYPRLYKIQLFNYASSCMPIKAYQKVPDILNKARAIPANSFNEEAETFQNSCYLELIYCLNSLQLEKSSTLVKMIKEGLVKYDQKINASTRITILHNVSILFFIKEDFEQSLDWVKKILWDRKVQSRKDLQIFDAILEMIIHFELKNYNILDHVHRATERFVKAHAPESLYLKAILNCLKHLIKAKNKSEANTYIKVLFNQLKDFQMDRNKYVGIDEIELWAKSKLENESILSLLEQQLNASQL